MKRSISLWQLAGLAFTAIGGTILHFLYEWTHSPSVIPIAAVNESTWEHMKILFFPMFFFAILQSFFFKGYGNFWAVKLLGITLGVLLVPTLFYTLNGAFGKTSGIVNILLFFISAALAFFVEGILFKYTQNKFLSKLCFTLLCIIAVLFILGTFLPPKLPLFQDPQTLKYGVPRK